MLAVLTLPAILSGAEESPFALQLFKAVVAGQKGNVLVSPACVEAGLKNLAEVTDGKTREELLTLNYGTPDTNPTMKPCAAAAIFADNQLPLVRGVKGVRRLPFSTDAETSVRHVNAWFAEKTRGLIPQMLTRDDISPDTRLLFAGSLYLREVWLEPFIESSTVMEHAFTLSDGASVNVPMMVCESSEEHRYAEGKDWQAVLLRVVAAEEEAWGNPAGFIAIRPRGDARAFAATMTPEFLQQLVEQLQRPASYTVGEVLHIHYVDVKMPRFSLRPDAVDIAPILQKLGVRSLFSQEADFSPLTPVPGLGLDGFTQSSRLVVHERGFSAASAFLATALGTWPQVKEMHHRIVLDKPFIFIIGSLNADATPYFMGICENPAEYPAEVPDDEDDMDVDIDI